MSMIDISNLDKLSKEQQAQFASILEYFPHLDSKMETSRDLNTPSKLEEAITPFREGFAKMSEELDYSNFLNPVETPAQQKRIDEIPKLKIDPEKSFFKSMEQEVEKESLTQEEAKVLEERKNQQRVQAAINAGQPPEIAKFNPTGKVHPVLQKLRATVGLRSVQPPVIVSLGGCNYSMRPLDRTTITKATLLALTATDNNMLYQTNLDVAIVAHSVVAIDNVPLIDIFSIPTEETPLGETTPVQLTKSRREDLAAQAFYTELLCSPNELVEGLSSYYQQEFPALNLIGAGKFKYVCPVSECLQSRIADEDTTCYCPIHGEKMAREDQLPNPF